MKLLLLLLLPVTISAQQFSVEERTFTNVKDTVTLSATITLPAKGKNPPVAILISGSGQTDRDETIFTHAIFKDLAEFLSARGIAVVRYDDRGGYRSTGRSVAKSTSYELSEDAEAIMLDLKGDQRFKRSMFGFIGHSEGGMIAPMIAARNKQVDFIVSLAGTGVDGRTVLITQNREIMLKQGVREPVVDAYITQLFSPAVNMLVTDGSTPATKDKIIELADQYRKLHKQDSMISAVFSTEKWTDMIIQQVGGTWGTYFLSTEPAQFWQQVTCPVLALNGDIDTQVNAELNLPVIEKSLASAKNKRVTILRLPQHNHLFQEVKTGSVMEYSQLEKGISGKTLKLVSDWITAL